MNNIARCTRINPHLRKWVINVFILWPFFKHHVKYHAIWSNKYFQNWNVNWCGPCNIIFKPENCQFSIVDTQKYFKWSNHLINWTFAVHLLQTRPMTILNWYLDIRVWFIVLSCFRCVYSMFYRKDVMVDGIANI